jgi:hypothetical protein
MTSTLRGFLIGITVVIVGLILFVGGVALGRSGWGIGGYGMAGMMTGFVPNAYAQTDTGSAAYDHEMPFLPCDSAGVRGYGPGMMDGFGRMGGAFGPDMMSTSPGIMRGGMMGSFGGGPYGQEVAPLPLEEAEAAVEGYLADLENDDLVLGEVMVFDNHAYAEIYEESTGIGALEVLVDPVTLAIYPEPGPNMMWNTKYGHMRGFGTVGMIGSSQFGGITASPDSAAEMPVSPDEAVETAQRYLDRYLPGDQVEDEVDAFYGYYTLHILRDGQTVGMLSVNGYTGQVFPHTWHGDFLEMSEDAHG